MNISVFLLLTTNQIALINDNSYNINYKYTMIYYSISEGKDKNENKGWSNKMSSKNKRRIL